MERSVIRDRLTPDYAALHPGYGPWRAHPSFQTCAEGPWSVLRAERNSPDPALLGEADPPLRRAIGELDDVDVGAELRNAPERHRPQRPELGQYRLVEQQLLARFRRHFRRHVPVVRLAATKRIDILTQCLLAARHGARAPPHRLAILHTRVGSDGDEACALSRHDDLKASPRGIGDHPGMADIGKDWGRSIITDHDVA